MFKPRPCLQDMPLLIKEKIVKEFNELERFPVRKISKDFQRIVDSTPAYYKLIKIDVQLDSRDPLVELTLNTMAGNEMVIRYQKAVKGCLVGVGQKNTFIPGKPFMERAILDMVTVLKNRRLRMETFRCKIDKERNQFCKLMTQELNKLSHQLHVEIVSQQGEEHPKYILSYLPHLKPGVLRKLDVSLTANKLWSTINETEQWQMAKELGYQYRHHTLSNFCGDLSHFERLNLVQMEMDAGSFQEFIEGLFEKKSMVSCHLRNLKFGRNKPEFDRYFEKFPEATPGDSSVRVIKDPNSDYSLMCKRIEVPIHWFGMIYPSGIHHIHLYKEGAV